MTIFYVTGEIKCLFLLNKFHFLLYSVSTSNKNVATEQIPLSTSCFEDDSQMANLGLHLSLLFRLNDGWDMLGIISVVVEAPTLIGAVANLFSSVKLTTYTLRGENECSSTLDKHFFKCIMKFCESFFQNRRLPYKGAAENRSDLSTMPHREFSIFKSRLIN